MKGEETFFQKGFLPLQNMVFDGDRALEHVRALCEPRLVGSDGEERARQYIKRALTQADLEVREEPFTFYPLTGIIMKAWLLGLLVLLSLGYGLAYTDEWLSRILFGLVLAMLVLSGSLSRWACRVCLSSRGKVLASWLRPFLGKKAGAMTSSNLLSTLSPLKGLREGHLLLVAHYDTKSQSLPLPMRILLIALTGAGGIGLSLLFLLDGQKTSILSLSLYSWTSLSLLALLLVKTTNDSPGAQDNGGSLGILLTLAESLRPGKIEITLLATAAEELGLLGAFAFCNDHALELTSPQEKVWVINLDGLGSGPRLYGTSSLGLWPKKEQGLLKALKEAAREDGLKLSRPWCVVGAMADHFPFAMMGIEALTLSSYSLKSWAIHSPGDTCDKINVGSLQKAGTILTRVIEVLEQ